MTTNRILFSSIRVSRSFKYRCFFSVILVLLLAGCTCTEISEYGSDRNALVQQDTSGIASHKYHNLLNSFKDKVSELEGEWDWLALRLFLLKELDEDIRQISSYEDGPAMLASCYIENIKQSDSIESLFVLLATQNYGVDGRVQFDSPSISEFGINFRSGLIERFNRDAWFRDFYVHFVTWNLLVPASRSADALLSSINENTNESTLFYNLFNLIEELKFLEAQAIDITGSEEKLDLGNYSEVVLRYSVFRMLLGQPPVIQSTDFSMPGVASSYDMHTIISWCNKVSNLEFYAQYLRSDHDSYTWYYDPDPIEIKSRDDAEIIMHIPLNPMREMPPGIPKVIAEDI